MSTLSASDGLQPGRIVVPWYHHYRFVRLGSLRKTQRCGCATSVLPQCLAVSRREMIKES